MMPGTTRRVIVLTAWAVYVKPDLSTLVVDLGLTGLPNVVGIDTVGIVIPRLKVPLIFNSRPHAPQPSQGRARGDDERPRLYGGPMASVKQIQVTFDCAEPERVARFWCEVLGYVVPPPPGAIVNTCGWGFVVVVGSGSFGGWSGCRGGRPVTCW